MERNKGKGKKNKGKGERVMMGEGYFRGALSDEITLMHNDTLRVCYVAQAGKEALEKSRSSLKGNV